MRSRTPIQQTEDLKLGQYEKHHVMIPLLISVSNISRNFSFQLSKCLVDSDLAIIGLTGIGLIFVVLAQCKFLYSIDRFDHIKANKSKLINKL